MSADSPLPAARAAVPAVGYDEHSPCDHCGRFGAFAFDGHNLCGDCYEARGSCCPEFTGTAEEAVPDDLPPGRT